MIIEIQCVQIHWNLSYCMHCKLLCTVATILLHLIFHMPFCNPRSNQGKIINIGAKKLRVTVNCTAFRIVCTDKAPYFKTCTHPENVY